MLGRGYFWLFWGLAYSELILRRFEAVPGGPEEGRSGRNSLKGITGIIRIPMVPLKGSEGSRRRPGEGLECLGTLEYLGVVPPSLALLGLSGL